MREFIIAAAALAFVPFAARAEDGTTDEQMATIDEVLAARSCKVYPANVEFDLDDVMCAGGQYDIKLDASFAVTEERKE